MPIIPPLPRPQRRHIHKIIHATRDKGHAHHLMAILLLHEGRTITDVHRLTRAARSTIGRWLRWYRDEGIDALEALPAGCAPVLPIAMLEKLCHHYRRAKTITLILDNYIIHKSMQTEQWLKKDPKFESPPVP